MSKYTTELRYLVEQGYELGLDLYPIYDEKYRAVLNKKIIDHYYFYEIGFETPARFRHYLVTTMNEIMGYYNELYKTQLLTVNPFYTVDYTETSTRTVDGESDTTDKRESVGAGTFTTTRNSDTDALAVESDTPAGLLSVDDIKTNTYASRASRQDDTQSTTGADESTNRTTDDGSSATKINNTEDYIKHVSGNMSGKSQSTLLQEYRETILNIDKMVIGELHNLFMGVFK